MQRQNALSQTLEQNYITTSLSPFIFANINFKGSLSSDTIKSFDAVVLANINSKTLATSRFNKTKATEPVLANTDPHF